MSYQFRGQTMVVAPTTRRIEAARRRATDARHLADRRPTEANLDRAAELEAGLARMEAQP